MERESIPAIVDALFAESDARVHEILSRLAELATHHVETDTQQAA